MRNYTPTSWHTSPTMLGRAYDIGAADGANIALVYGPEENGTDEFAANARLIAAAPDLFAALLEVEAFLDNRADADCDQDGFIPNEEMRLLNEVSAALNKARG